MNLSFGKFNQIFANDAIAHAIVDRLVNEAEVFYMEGESYRLGPSQRLHLYIQQLAHRLVLLLENDLSGFFPKD